MKYQPNRLLLLAAFILPAGGCEGLSYALAPSCIEWEVPVSVYDPDLGQWEAETIMYEAGNEDERVREKAWVESQWDRFLDGGNMNVGAGYNLQSPVTGNAYYFEVVCNYYEYY